MIIDNFGVSYIFLLKSNFRNSCKQLKCRESRWNSQRKFSTKTINNLNINSIDSIKEEVTFIHEKCIQHLKLSS
jgi:hypothetical protein